MKPDFKKENKKDAHINTNMICHKGNYTFIIISNYSVEC